MPKRNKLEFGFPFGALQDEIIELFEDGRKSFVEIARDAKLSSVGVKKRI